METRTEGTARPGPGDRVLYEEEDGTRHVGKVVAGIPGRDLYRVAWRLDSSGDLAEWISWVEIEHHPVSDGWWLVGDSVKQPTAPTPADWVAPDQLRGLAPAQLAAQLTRFYLETFQAERVDTSRALELLAASRDLLLQLDATCLPDRDASPRIYLVESERKEGGGGTYPVSVVLALIPDADAVQPFAVWFKVYPEEGDPYTVEGSYSETLAGALEAYETRCNHISVEPWGHGEVIGR